MNWLHKLRARVRVVYGCFVDVFAKHFPRDSNRFGDRFLAYASAAFFNDSLPCHAVGDLFQHVLYKNTRASKRGLSVADLWVRNDATTGHYHSTMIDTLFQPAGHSGDAPSLCGSLRHNHRWSFHRTACITSAGMTPIAPLITDRCKVVSLSTRTRDGLLRPVVRQSGWIGPTATVRGEAGTPGAEVMNATRKSSAESHRASTRHGRRLAPDRSVNGNAAWTISPGRNMRGLFSKSGIFPPRQNIEVAVNIRLFLEEVERAAGFRQTRNLCSIRLGGVQHQHGQPGLRGQRHPCRQFQQAVGIDSDLNRFHKNKIQCARRIANPQSSPFHHSCIL